MTTEQMNDYFEDFNTHYKFTRLMWNGYENAARTVINDFCEENPSYDVQDFDVKITEDDDE